MTMAVMKKKMTAGTNLGSGKISSIQGSMTKLNTMKNTAMSKSAIGPRGTALTGSQVTRPRQSLADFKSPVAPERTKVAPAKSVGGMYTRTSRVTADANANAQVSNETKFRTAMADFEKQKATAAKSAPAKVAPAKVATTPVGKALGLKKKAAGLQNASKLAQMTKMTSGIKKKQVAAKKKSISLIKVGYQK
jgi:hypothetical protein